MPEIAIAPSAARLRARWRVDKRLVRALDCAGFAVLLGMGVFLGVGFLMFGVRVPDTDMVWSASRHPTFYSETWVSGLGGSYIYPPPLAQVLSVIPWVVFLPVWTVVLFVSLWVLTRWWALPFLAVSGLSVLLWGLHQPFMSPLALALTGNSQAILAAAIVFGFRWPATWAFVVLTKIAPGVGLLWFAVRGEWRSLGIALGVTVAIAALSFVLAPGAWADFLRFAVANAGTPSPEPVVPIPFGVRAAMSAALIVWGARTDRRWTVLIGAGWTSLALYEWSYVAVWIGALGLPGWQSRRQPG